MKLVYDFVAEHDMDIVENELSAEELKTMLASLGFVPGPQFLAFVQKYSYLAYMDVEFFGIDSEMKEKSTTFLTTKSVCDIYPSVKGYFVIDALGDGYYVVVDGDDFVYDFFMGDSDEPEATGIKLDAYMLQRLEEAE